MNDSRVAAALVLLKATLDSDISPKAADELVKVAIDLLENME